MKKILLDYNFDSVKNILVEQGEKPFRATQIFTDLHLYKSFDEMTVLSKSLREKLKENYIDNPVKILKSVKSKDGTEKFLFSLYDGNVIEGVLMKYKYGYTLCVSTQVGCRMGCTFCASTLNGLVRNLSSGEILSQVLLANKYLQGGLKDKRKIINVVLMGSGEPLDNYDNVLQFLRNLSDEKGINISPRNVSLSTSGIVPKMYDLANENLPINLTVSLHSPFDEHRKKIMPIAKAYSISEILKACDNYFDKTKRRFIFEYVLIKGESATKECANELIKILKGKPCHVNLIRLNEVKERDLKGISDKEAYAFMDILVKNGISASVRRRMGADIDGACGQLRQRFIEENDDWSNL